MRESYIYMGCVIVYINHAIYYLISSLYVYVYEISCVYEIS